jgi:DNA repair protein RadC
MMLYIQDEGGTYLPASKEMIFSTAKRLSSAQLKRGAIIESSDNAKAAIQHKLSGYQYEMFACLFLDSQHRVLAFQEMFRGSVNSATIHPREVVKEALRLNAAAVILAHNHPSGETNPSTQDIDLTTKLRDILRVIDVRVLDHLVVGDTVLSMADLGHLS